MSQTSAYILEAFDPFAIFMLARKRFRNYIVRFTIFSVLKIRNINCESKITTLPYWPI